jgi:hypothetical protein
MGAAFSSLIKPLNCSSHQLSYLPQALVPSVQSLLDAACTLQLPGLVLLGYVVVGLATVFLLLRELLGRAFKYVIADLASSGVSMFITNLFLFNTGSGLPR